jgi:hypothetical protein
MKKIIITILALVMGIFMYSQTNSTSENSEFSRAYLNVLVTYYDEDGEKQYKEYEGSNVFTFNVDGNSIMFYKHSGDVSRYIYLDNTINGTDDAGDTYQLIKTIDVESSETVYFQLYDNKDFGLKLIYEESVFFIHFYNKITK